MNVSQCLHIPFLNHTIDIYFFSLKYCLVTDLEYICNGNNAIVTIIKWLYKLLWDSIGISSLYGIISLENAF